MPEVSDPRFEAFLVEPMTDLAGTQVPAPRRFYLAHLLGRLGPLGMLALAEGLVLLGCFCFPWYARPDDGVAAGLPGASGPPLVSYSGWTTAVALPTGLPGVSLIFAPHLLLIPLCALALLIIAWSLIRQRITARLAIGITLASSVLTLLLALSFAVWMASEEATFEAVSHHMLPYPVYNTSWGCWLTLLVSGISSTRCIVLLKTDAPVLASSEGAPPVSETQSI